MSLFTTPAAAFMSSPVATVRDDARALDAEATLDRLGITAVGVVDGDGALVGVLSRTDLIESGEGEAGSTFSVPDVAVRELMSSSPVTVAPSTPLDAVAAKLLSEKIHRVFVCDDGTLQGVISTRDMMEAVADARVERPLHEIATPTVVTVSPDTGIGEAVDKLESTRVTGLIVVEAGAPIGVFTQVDALLARAHGPGTPVDDVMSLRVLAVRSTTPMHRAARRAIAMSVRRLVLVDDGTLAGVVSSSDFSRVVAG